MLNLAGHVCCAHSAMGPLDREQALSFAHFLIYCGLRARLQEPIVVTENVDSFPREEVEGMLDNNDNSKNGAIFGYLWGIVVPQWCGSEGDI